MKFLCEKRKLGELLVALVSEEICLPMRKYIDLMRLVLAMFLCRVITKRTVKKFIPLDEWFTDVDVCAPVGFDKSMWEERLRSYLRPVFELMFRIFAKDEKLKKQNLSSVAQLVDYLNTYEVPASIYMADYGALWNLVDSSLIYDSVAEELYFWDKIKKDDGRVIPVVKKLSFDGSIIWSKDDAEVLFYGVDRMFLNEEDGNRRILMNMPKLHGVFVMDLRYNVKLFMSNRYMQEGEIKGDISSYRTRIEELSPTKLEAEERIGGFRIDADEKFTSKSVPLREGKFDPMGHCVLINTDAGFHGSVIYDCKEERFNVYLPSEVKIGIIDKVKRAFRLREEETVYRFRNGEKEVEVLECSYEYKEDSDKIEETVVKRKASEETVDTDDVSFDEFAEYLKREEDRARGGRNDENGSESGREFSGEN